MTKRKLIKDVDVQTMFEMRERGMTNSEIAEALDVKYNTIIRHIGKQPAGMPRSRRRVIDQQDQNSDHKQTINLLPLCIVEQEYVRIGNETVRIDYKEKQIELRDDVFFSFDEAADLMIVLKAVSERIREANDANMKALEEKTKRDYIGDLN